MDNFENLKYIGILILLVVGLASCNKEGPAETAGKNIDQTMDTAGHKINDVTDRVAESMSEQSHSVGVVISDTEITTRVKAAIFAKPGLDSLKISVDTEKGVVTLSGNVASLAYSDMANTLASEVTGVSKVKNHLAVKSN